MANLSRWATAAVLCILAVSTWANECCNTPVGSQERKHNAASEPRYKSLVVRPHFKETVGPVTVTNLNIVIGDNGAYWEELQLSNDDPNQAHVITINRKLQVNGSTLRIPRQIRLEPDEIKTWGWDETHADYKFVGKHFEKLDHADSTYEVDTKAYNAGRRWHALGRPPVITRLSPDYGYVGETNKVVDIYGDLFGPAPCTCDFGPNIRVRSCTRISGGLLRARIDIPDGPIPIVDVSVTNASGDTGTLPGSFSIYP